jgi:hypothetical protein
MEGETTTTGRILLSDVLFSIKQKNKKIQDDLKLSPEKYECIDSFIRPQLVQAAEKGLSTANIEWTTGFAGDYGSLCTMKEYLPHRNIKNFIRESYNIVRFGDGNHTTILVTDITTYLDMEGITLGSHVNIVEIAYIRKCTLTVYF